MDFVFCFMLLVWTKTAIVQTREGPPVITSQSDRQVFYTSYTPSLNLSCRADGSFPLIFVWEHYGGVIQNHTMYNGVSNLTLRPLNDWIEGMYTCIVGNKYGRALSDNMEVTEMMIYPTTIPAIHVIHNPLVNMPFTLSCDQLHSNSEMTPEIHWVKVTTTTNLSSRVQYNNRITYDTDGNLHFLYIDKSDQGEYRCNVTHPITQNYTLGPTIILEPMDMGTPTIPIGYHMWSSENHPIGLQGQNLTLRCIYGGRPIPQIRWQKILDDGTSTSMHNVEDYGRNLIFQNISFTDAGEYACVADTDYIWFNVVVESTPVWIEKPRPITTSPSTGYTISFVCGAVAFPVPDIVWYINTESPTSFIPTNGNLVLFRVNRTQSGDRVRSVLSVTANSSFSLKCTCENYHSSISAYSYLYITENVTHPSTAVLNRTSTPSSFPESTMKLTQPSTPVPIISTLPWTPEPNTKSTLPWTPEPNTKSSLPWTPEPNTKSSLPWTPEPNTKSTFLWTPEPSTKSTLPWTPEPNIQSTLPWTPTPTFKPTPTTTLLPTSAPTPIPNRESERSNIPVIGGAAGGGIAVLIAVIVVFYCISSKRRKNMDSDVRIGYGNKGYSDAEMDVGKLHKMGHQKQNKDKREVYSGLSFERENKKGNVYEQLGNTNNVGKIVENKPEETEYCYISDVDFMEAQKQSQSPTPTAKPVLTSSTEISCEGVQNSMQTNPKALVKDEPRTYMNSNTKPHPKAPTSNNPSYGKRGRFASGKYSAIGNPAYSSEIPQLSLQNQTTQHSYEEPVTTRMSPPRKGAAETPDDGYFKLEPINKK